MSGRHVKHARPDMTFQSQGHIQPYLLISFHVLNLPLVRQSECSDYVGLSSSIARSLHHHDQSQRINPVFPGPTGTMATDYRKCY